MYRAKFAIHAVALVALTGVAVAARPVGAVMTATGSVFLDY